MSRDAAGLSVVRTRSPLRASGHELSADRDNRVSSIATVWSPWTETLAAMRERLHVPLPRDRAIACHRHVGAGAAERTEPSSMRAVIPSFGKIRYRCVPTVRCETNSRWPISRLERPLAARWAIWSSCAVS